MYQHEYEKLRIVTGAFETHMIGVPPSFNDYWHLSSYLNSSLHTHRTLWNDCKVGLEAAEMGDRAGRS